MNTKQIYTNFFSVVLLLITIAFSSCSPDYDDMQELENLSFDKDATSTSEKASNNRYFVKEYVFHRSPGPFDLGHSGVGFEVRTYQENDLIAIKYYFGAIENYRSNVYIPSGTIGNDGWYYTTNNEQMMLMIMKGSFSYTEYKYTEYSAEVSLSDIENAIRIIANFPNRGYSLFGNNCMNAAWEVLNALPVADEPRPIGNPSPDSWFYGGFYRTPQWTSAINYL